MMPFILINLIEIYLVSRIFTEMDITLKLCNGNEYLLITGEKQIFEQLISSSYGLYQTTIRLLEFHSVMNQKFNDPKAFLLWHERLGHPGLSMMCCIVQNSNGHPLTSRQILKYRDFSCTACSQGKLIIKTIFYKDCV